MGVTKSKIQVCRDCGNEKTRRERGGRYTYFCHCLVWREQLGVLEHARKKERRKRVHLREVPREDRMRMESFIGVGRPMRDLQTAGGVS
jgi:hypothetical protein